MCGIAGFSCFHQNFGGEYELKQMGVAMESRGPDSAGEFTDENIGLCHRRLSIIDLSSAGDQPMHSADGNLVIAFNGEIYNFLELREQLLALGYHFNSKTDTEVLLNLYQRYGENVVDHINGMFAFAIWDKKNEKLFMARDRLGKKPLYYTFVGGDIIFASELKALQQINQVKREIRPDAVYDFFIYQYIPDPKTIYKNIFKLTRGTVLRLIEPATRSASTGTFPSRIRWTLNKIV